MDKKLLVFLTLASCHLAYADDNKILLKGFTPEETLSLFKETQGLSLDINSKVKTATINVILPASSRNIWKFGLVGKFDGTDSTFADEDGLANDVTLNISHTQLFYDKDSSFSAEIKIPERKAALMHEAKVKFMQCASELLPMEEDESYSTYLDRLKKSKLASEIQLGKCKSEWVKINRIENETNSYDFYRSYYYFTQSGSYSPGKHKYYNQESLQSASKDIESIKASLEFGFFEFAGTNQKKWWDAQKFSLGIEYIKGDKTEETSKSNICVPLAESTSVSKCLDTYLQPSYESESVGIFGKYSFTRIDGALVKGLDFIIKNTWSDKNYVDSSKDIDIRRWSISLPVTFFVNKEHDVKAGLSAHWREHLKSDKEDFDVLTFGIFVTKGFDLAKF